MTTMDGQKVAARARDLVGARFRPQGRRAEAGLDCVGLVALAIGAERARGNYQLRGGSLDALEKELVEAGLERVDDARPGDVVVMRSGPRQLHLGIATGSGIVHADARLRRVVERPGPPAWPILCIWRLAAKNRIGEAG
jgi:cell wall-associated NlpC family hydrolase